jgi:hypothetical protein
MGPVTRTGERGREMGLDNYAVSTRPPDDWTDADRDLLLAPEARAALYAAQAEIERERDGCFFEGRYFRGKYVQELIMDITGVSIYEDWIPPETIEKMADVLAECDPEEAIRAYEASEGFGGCTPGELSDLIVFFRICADYELGLVSSC